MLDDTQRVSFQQAIDHFNAREFFACHDVLEEIWAEVMGVDRDFFQGLIHASVALFHFEGGNLAGARKMHDSAIRYLSHFEDRHYGVDLARFRMEFDECFRPLLGEHQSYPENVILNESLIPQLHIQ
ncbi:DUF309 domain-containing protein [Planctomicrobium sp. SH661]|uniref:DUF309 domain-containing protein n=1 Tax=Planctomicrobium sp. SH661 TaxID=3448124 RepID=UPI003F5C1E6B